MPRRSRPLLALLGASLILPGCTSHAFKSGAYETLHNISDERNDQGDPRVDQAPRPSYDEYLRQREEALHPAPAPEK